MWSGGNISTFKVWGLIVHCLDNTSFRSPRYQHRGLYYVPKWEAILLGKCGVINPQAFNVEGFLLVMWLQPSLAWKHVNDEKWAWGYAWALVTKGKHINRDGNNSTGTYSGGWIFICDLKILNLTMAVKF